MKEHKTIGQVSSQSEPHVQWIYQDAAIVVSVSDEDVRFQGYRLTPQNARRMAELLLAGADLVADCKLADGPKVPSWRQRPSQL